MRFSDYRALDATDMISGVRDKDFTPDELLAAAQDRKEKVNPTINAVVLDLHVEAKAQLDAGLPKGALHGVPFLVKDMDGTLAGQPCSTGSRSLKDWVPDHDSNLFARYRAGGVAFLGKTNCPEFGIMGITEPELWGPARNPWNTDHTTGGSSGGSAAAVAAGIVPVAHAGDGGGSIRIPAAYNGIFGLKPSRGRMPLGPDLSEGWNGLVVPHVVSRSVRDSALFLEATHGPDLGAPYGEPPGSAKFLDALKRAPKGLRIGFTRKAFLADEQHPEIVAAIEDAMSLVSSLGHEAVELDLDLDLDAVAQAYLTINAACVANDVANTRLKTGVDPRSDLFERPTWFLAQVGQALNGRELENALTVVGSLTRSVAAQFESIDVHVSSVTAQPQAEVGSLDLSFAEKWGLTTMRRLSSLTGPALNPVFKQAVAQLASDSLERTPNTQVYNMTGQPAMSVPLAWTSDGLPIGIQFAAKYGQEFLLLQLAAQLEEARPWFERVPPL